MSGRYACIVADPPWMYQKQPGSKGQGEGAPGIAEREYPTMTNEEIAALPVADLAAPDAHLFMWVTNPGLYGGRFSDLTPAQIAEAWGFRYVTLLTWVKSTPRQEGRPTAGGMGWYFRGCTEHVLYAVRGKASIPAERREPNVLLAPRLGHSEKPEAFMDLVERVVDGPYLELFARTERPGWDSWGNEVAAAPPRQGNLFASALVTPKPAVQEWPGATSSDASHLESYADARQRLVAAAAVSGSDR